jgi:hypothetical protein
LPALWAFDVQSQKATRLTPKNYLAGTAFGSTTTTFFFSAATPAKRKIRFIECPQTEKSETPDQERALSKRERSGCMKQFIVAIFPLRRVFRDR